MCSSAIEIKLPEGAGPAGQPSHRTMAASPAAAQRGEHISAQLSRQFLAKGGDGVMGSTAAHTRIPELDGLRGIAILLVVFFHYGYGVPMFAPGSVPSYLIAPVIRLGWTGVDLFFVLSGFLICNLLLQLTSAANGFGTFYARRAARTLPLYSLMLSLFVLGSAAHAAAWIDLPRMFGAVHFLWSYFVMMQNNLYAIKGADLNFISVSWSLAIEEQFYLLFPLLFLLQTNPRHLLISLCGIVLCSIAFRATGTVLPVGLGHWQYYFTLCRLDGLAVGAGIAVVLTSGRWRGKLEQGRGYILVACMLLGVGMIAEAKWSGLLNVFLYTWLAAFYGSVLLLVILGYPITAVLRARGLRFFGDISYGLYLIHIPVQGLLVAWFVSPQAEPQSQRPLLCTMLAIVISLSLALASRRFVEQPAIRAARRLTRGYSTPLATSSIAPAST
jgi:peptidoglycan/LPS O-acetylase OafA/YrhL